jgi:hypothetical protein
MSFAQKSSVRTLDVHGLASPTPKHTRKHKVRLQAIMRASRKEPLMLVLKPAKGSMLLMPEIRV